ncbi:MAG: glycosyltransferase, partial [Anaerolineae bacterium]|nr:glycosyltransferase [Anaerolineae bacterium]
VLLTAGRLERAKGHHLALQVAARLPGNGHPVLVMVAGSGPDEDWLHAQADALGLAERVCWLGHMPRDEMPAAYNAADAVLMLSLHTEAFAYAVVEAMSCGRPVVASRVGGLPTAITDGQDGFLVPAGDVNAATERVLALLRDSERRAAMGRAARQTVLERFTLERMVADTEGVFLRYAAGQGVQA